MFEFLLLANLVFQSIKVSSAIILLELNINY